MHVLRLGGVFAVTSIVSLGLAHGARTCDARIPQQIRIQDCLFAASVADGLDKSPTLRQIDRVVELDGIVYVVTGGYASLRRRDLSGPAMVSLRRATRRR